MSKVILRLVWVCITTLCDWLTSSRHFLNQWESKPKPIVLSPHAFSRAWRQLYELASNSDWLVVLFTSIAIGQSNYFGFGFTTLNWKPLYTIIIAIIMKEEEVVIAPTKKCLQITLLLQRSPRKPVNTTPSFSCGKCHFSRLY